VWKSRVLVGIRRAGCAERPTTEIRPKIPEIQPEIPIIPVIREI